MIEVLREAVVHLLEHQHRLVVQEIINQFQVLRLVEFRVDRVVATTVVRVVEAFREVHHRRHHRHRAEVDFLEAHHEGEAHAEVLQAGDNTFN